MRRCPGVGGRECGTFVSPLFRDPHPTCTRCRGRSCSSTSTCNICDGWSLDQWEHSRLKRDYILRSHVCLPLPPCLHKSRERGGGTPLRSVLGRGMPPPPPSLRRGEESAQPQPDALADKSPPSPGPLRLKISSYHHVDDWGEEGEYRVPSPAPSSLHAKRRREEREQGTDRSRAPDFQGKSARHRSPSGEHPRPRGHDRYAAPAHPRSSPLRALPVGD